MTISETIIWGTLIAVGFFTTAPVNTLTPKPVQVKGDTPEVTLETTPQRKAALDTIAYGEGTYIANGYKTMFGHGTFESFADHPRKCIKFRNTCSTAAGRYQFLNTRWDEISEQYSLKDFTPENQDKAAIALLVKENGKEILDKIDAGDSSWVYGVCKTWASFPCATGDRHGAYGQNPKRSEKLKKFYKERLQHYGGV